MRCPNCGERDTRVIDSRDLDDSVTIRRRRECAACATRFTTYERIESARLAVLKRGGGREDFDRTKLVAGLAKALKGRPVPADAAEKAGDEIEATLRSEGINEVPSSRIGEMALDRLREIDNVAYVFFAGVFRSFHDLEVLKREVDRLYAEHLVDAPGQTSLELVPAKKRPVPPIRTASASRRSARR